jgi:protein-tyrosine phosphatase
MEQNISEDVAAPSARAGQARAPLSVRIQGLVEQYRTLALWSTVNQVWRQWFAWVTGIPLLCDGRITPLIYVGPQYGWLGKWKLKRAGIRHVVSLRAEFNDAEYGLTLGSYCYLPTEDETAPSMEHLWRGVTFIRQAVERGERVYIHCMAGKGRAPTMAAAYLISRGMDAFEALETVCRGRRCTDLTPVQREQLVVFQSVLPPWVAEVGTGSPHLVG